MREAVCFVCGKKEPLVEKRSQGISGVAIELPRGWIFVAKVLPGKAVACCSDACATKAELP